MPTKIDTVQFQLYGLQTSIDVRMEYIQTGIDKADPSAYQACTLATITGRKFTGEVFKAAGISITHPTDPYNVETGAKLAVQDAARALYYNQGMPEWYFLEEEYIKIWWSAYQRARHGREPWIDPPDWKTEVTFS